MRGAIILVLVGACGSDGSMTMPPGPAVVTLGTLGPDGGWAPLAGDQTMIAGAQGGFHVWLEYRIAGMTPGQVNVERTARRAADGKLILKTDDQVEVGEAGPDGYWQTPTALPNFMCPAPLGVQVNDQPIHFELVITDDDGNVLGTGEADATPHCPLGDENAFCENICSGN